MENNLRILSCKKCKKLYKHFSIQSCYCPNCEKELNEVLKEVKIYVRENKRCTINSVADAFNIKTAVILYWIKQESLEFAEDSDIKLNCEKCGKIINTGRLCSSCKKECFEGFNNILEEPKNKELKDLELLTQKPIQKMRFLDHKNY